MKSEAEEVTGPLMPARRKWSVWLVAGLVWTSGVAWLLLHYLARRQGEFGPEPHPAEIWMLRLHGAAAFASLWLLGLLWTAHITRAWGRHQRRWSGALMSAAAGLLVLSAYLLYYLGDDTARTNVGVLHWSLGVGALILFLLHARKARAE